jgi:FkbM family methyltransferase
MDLRKVPDLQGSPVKIGVLSPTTWQLVEKMAALFPEGVEVVGPLADGGHYWNDYRRKMREWEDLGLHVTLRLSPYDRIDFSDYDVLIESVETFSYSRDWLDQCYRLECPVLLKACWTRDPLEVLPAPTSYFKRRKSFPVLLEMPAHARNWQAAGFRDVNVLPNPVGDWWFARPWSGEQERVLFVLSGAKAWRGDPSWFGLDMWEEIKRAFPGRAHHHDGDVSYLTSREMTDLYGSSRVFVNLDRTFGQGERPLTLAFTEALSAGLPVVARDLPGLSYRQFINSNGVCTNDLFVMCSFIEKCLSTPEFAAEHGARSRQVALEHFSCKVLRPQYDQLIKRARQEFERQKAEKDAGVLHRAFAFLRRRASSPSSVGEPSPSPPRSRAEEPVAPPPSETLGTGEVLPNRQVREGWQQRVHDHLASIQKAGGEYQYFELLRDHAVGSGIPGNRAKILPFLVLPILMRATRIVELGCSFTYYPRTYPDRSPWKASTSEFEGLVSTRTFLIACRFLNRIGVPATVTSVDIRNTSLYRNAEALLTDLSLIDHWRPVMGTDSIEWLRQQTEKIDIALVDSHHTYAQVSGELNGLQPLMSEHGIIIVDDCYNLDYQTGVDWNVDETPAGVAKGGQYGALLEFLEQHREWVAEWVPDSIASVAYLYRRGESSQLREPQPAAPRPPVARSSPPDRPAIAYPDAFRAFPFRQGSIARDVIRTRVGSVQRRSFDAGIAEDQRVQDEFLFDFYCSPRVPTDNPGVFEWLDICETVLLANDTYTFVELGAGYARWSVIAYFLATRFRDLRVKLICVEPEPTHYRWAVQNFLDNGIRPRDHVLLEGAVARKNGYVLFQVGDPAAWYGQSVIQEVQPSLRERLLMPLRAQRRRRNPGVNDTERGRKVVKAYSLASVLASVRCADLVHMDLQGSEYEALAGAISVINEKVKRLHIGTHSPTIEARFRTLLGENGWTCLRNNPQGRRVTEFGQMDFEDGIQTWINPRLPR